jgi:hypothetical protein
MMMRLAMVAALAAAGVSACTVTVQEGDGEAGESGRGGSSSAGRSAGGSGGDGGAGGSVVSSGGSSTGGTGGSGTTDGASGEGGAAGATEDDAGGEGGASTSPRGRRGGTGGGGGTGGASASTGGAYATAGSAGATQVGSCTLVSMTIVPTNLSPTDGCEATFACDGPRAIEVTCDGENDGTNTSLCDCREGRKTAAVNGTVPGEAPDSCLAGAQRCLTALAQ